jgi:dTDP-4-dehydrorhamnose reductase
MITSPILVLGAHGQVGRALMNMIPDAIGLSRDDCDLTRIDRLPETLEKYKAGAIINAAAYTAVDRAEDEEPIAHLINAEAPTVMAAFCKGKGIPFIHYSTDYVFDGSGGTPWHETDEAAPLNAYGRTKLAGEQGIIRTGGNHLIFRTSWVYDAEGKNFLNTMLRLGNEKEQLSVVDDQFGAPSYAPHLAEATLDALRKSVQSTRFPSGIYHMCNGGVTSWMNFAKQIFALGYRKQLPLVVKAVNGIPTEQYPTPAKRPANSRLDCSKLRNVLGIELPHWEDGLRHCMDMVATMQRVA